jgi:hypothetical protein
MKMEAAPIDHRGGFHFCLLARAFGPANRPVRAWILILHNREKQKARKVAGGLILSPIESEN